MQSRITISTISLSRATISSRNTFQYYMENDDREKSEWLKEMEALARSNAALRCLCELQSRRSGFRLRREFILHGGESGMDLPERHERLVRAVELLAADLETIQTRVQLQRSLRLRANIARLILFMAGALAFIAMFYTDMPTS